MSNSFLKRAMTTIVVVSVLFNVLGCGEVDVSQYKGDGRIIPAGTGIGRGYLIEFDKFDLSESFSKRYVIADYPMIDQPLDFGLAFRLEEAALDDVLDGHLSYRVSTFSNEVLFSCSSELKNWIHSDGGYDEGTAEYFCYFWDDDKGRCGSCLDPQERRDISNLKKLYLDVQYEPKSTKKKVSASIKKKVSASIQLKVGGFK